MLNTHKIKQGSKDLAFIKMLHNESFPDNERAPLDSILEDTTNTGEIYSFYDKDTFCGYACILNDRDISHIIFLAVEKKLRDKGYGSKILKSVQKLKHNQKIIVDIELESKEALNNSQRIKRRQFYYKNNYKPTNITYAWNDDNFTILSYGGDVTHEEFNMFWERIYKHHPNYKKY